jgi:hypothetical protein
VLLQLLLQRLKVWRNLGKPFVSSTRDGRWRAQVLLWLIVDHLLLLLGWLVLLGLTHASRMPPMTLTTKKAMANSSVAVLEDRRRDNGRRVQVAAAGPDLALW